MIYPPNPTYTLNPVWNFIGWISWGVLLYSLAFYGIFSERRGQFVVSLMMILGFFFFVWVIFSHGWEIEIGERFKTAQWDNRQKIMRFNEEKNR